MTVVGNAPTYFPCRGNILLLNYTVVLLKRIELLLQSYQNCDLPMIQRSVINQCFNLDKVI